MDTTRRRLMAERDAALAAGDRATFQALTTQIAQLPLKGVAPLTTRDIDRYRVQRADGRVVYVTVPPSNND